ncbi:MAG TPA: HNH endonuclease [Patescibacteria group bacterium]|nr:HNH endonuclease [Patescibacteria group bacterium]
MAAKSAQVHSLKTSIRSKSEKRLSDGDLLARLEKSRGTERALQRRIVLDLAEVERRRLYLPRGYGSLFEFCTDYLHYSRSSAGRRISAARCIALFPRMAEMFERGECDLTVLAAIAGIVTKENCAEIVSWLRGKTLREVEAFAQRRQPGRAVRDQVRQIYVMSVKQDTKIDGDPPSSNESPTPDTAPRNGAEPPAADTKNADPGEVAELHHYLGFTPSAGTKTAQLVNNTSVKNRGVRSGSGDGSSSATASMSASPVERVVVDRKFKLQFAVDPAFMVKFKRVRSLLSTKYPNLSNFEMLFDILMTEYLDRHSPERRLERRNARKKRAAGKKNTSGSAATRDPEHATPNRNGEPVPLHDTHRKEAVEPACGSPSDDVCRGENPAPAKRNRYIPPAVRDEVFARDDGRCTFVSDNGKRCNSLWNLQIDHIIPFAKGGDSSPGNLRLLCARHNISEAEREYGAELMKKFRQRE